MSIRRLNRLLPVLLAAGLVSLSCSRDTTSPALTPQFEERGRGEESSAEHTSKLLFCRALPYAADTATIGALGGVLHIGPNKLVIPPGALSHPVTIIGDAPSDTVRSVQLFPHGLTFHRDVYLTLNYTGCMSSPGEHATHRIAYTDDDLNVIYYLPSIDRPLHNKVTAPLGHFSRYAVGW